MSMRGEWTVAALWVTVGCFSLVFCLYHVASYRSSLMTFDMALFTQEMWNLLHGRSWNSLLGGHLLGDHQHVIAYLLLPLFTIAPHPLLLTTVQSIALGLGAVGVYGIGVALLKDRRWSFLMACLYLLYPPLWNISAWDFHFEALATPSLVLMLWAYVTRRFGIFVASIFLVLSCKENMSAVMAAFGLFAWLQRGRCRWAVAPLLLGVGWLLLLLFVIQPAVWVHRPVDYWWLYKEWGEGRNGVLLGLLSHPHWAIMKVIANPEFWRYQLHLLLPLGFLPILQPGWLLVTAPIWFQHWLSWNVWAQGTGFHHPAPVVPFVFMAGLAALQRIPGILSPPSTSRLKPRHLAVMLAILTWCEGTWAPSSVNAWLGDGRSGAYPSLFGRLLTRWQPSAIDRMRQRLVNSLPAEASVVSSGDMLIYVAKRRNVYTWHSLLWLFEPLETVLGVTPADRADYLLLDFSEVVVRNLLGVHGSAERLTAFLERGGWKPTVLIDNLSLWGRAEESPVSLVDALASPPSPQLPVGQQVTGDLRLLGLDVSSEPLDDQQLLTLHLYWEATRDPTRLYFIGVEVREDGRLLNTFRPRAMGYGIFPTFRWKTGTQVKETQTVLLHPPQTGRVTLDLYLYTERVLFYDSASRRYVGQFRYRPVMNRVRLGSFRVEDEAWFPADGVPLPAVVEGLLDSIRSSS